MVNVQKRVEAEVCFFHSGAKKAAGIRAVVFGIVLAVCAICGGCSSDRALDPEMKSIDTSRKSIGIFTIRTVNQVSPDYQALAAKIWVAADGSGKSMRIKCYSGDGPDELVEKQYSEQYASISLDPANYTLEKIMGLAQSILFIGHFQVPMATHFQLPPNSVVYLGRLTLTNRERKGNERRSGGMFPLIDQAITGYSGGTTDVVISDESGEDIPEFVRRYPCLKGMIIKKIIMKNEIKSSNK